VSARKRQQFCNSASRGAALYRSARTHRAKHTQHGHLVIGVISGAGSGCCTAEVTRRVCRHKRCLNDYDIAVAASGRHARTLRRRRSARALVVRDSQVDAVLLGRCGARWLDRPAAARAAHSSGAPPAAQGLLHGLRSGRAL
jgi:hypothetical protein